MKSDLTNSLESGEKSEPQFIRRADGRIERICEHGVGHTVDISGVRYVDFDDERSVSAWWSHGCDGCCSEYVGAFQQAAKAVIELNREALDRLATL